MDLPTSWELGCGGADSKHFQVLEEGIASTIGIDPRVAYLLLVLTHGHFQTVGPSKFRYRHLKLLHEQLYNFIHFLMDDELSSLVNLSLLEVYHDEFASVSDAGEWHHAGWIDSHARTHCNDQVRLSMQGESFIKNSFYEVLSKVDDSVFELAFAAWSVADAPSFVLLSFLSVANAVVAHMLSATLDTEFKVSVAVKVR